jgi:hypothetical protein
MLKSLYDRFIYAFIGFVLGAALAAVLWFLYDQGFSRQPNHPEVRVGLATWIKYVGGAFALIGFFLKSRVGESIGTSSAEVYNYEAGNYELPTWLAVLVLVAVVGGVWYFMR